MRFKNLSRTISESFKDPIWKITGNFTLKWPQCERFFFLILAFYDCI